MVGGAGRGEHARGALAAMPGGAELLALPATALLHGTTKGGLRQDAPAVGGPAPWLDGGAGEPAEAACCLDLRGAPREEKLRLLGTAAMVLAATFAFSVLLGPLLEALPYAQRDVHGLLGQRSVSPSPMRGPAAWGPNPLGALALSTAQLHAANGAAGGGSAGTLQVAIDADGHHQGEGAIEGSYRDYGVRYISSHGPGAPKHTRFVCGAAAGSAASVEA